MTTIDYLEKLYIHAFDMVKFGENKNTLLIVFNGAVIIGMAKLSSVAENPFLYYFLLYIIVMCAISIFICISALVATIKHSTDNTSLQQNDNLLFFATLAHLTHDQLIDELKDHYQCESSNINHEKDLARQVIITSQIAARKYKLFNIAIAFTIAGLLTPLSLIIYKFLFVQDK